MARPQKVGIDYFPLDVDMDQDDKIAMIEAVHGIEGFGVVIKLLMKIYKEGYYYKWTEREQILFSKRINVDINRVNAIINDCIKWDLFDKELFNKYHILTSRGIQKRYLEAVKRRTSIELIQEFLLLTSCDIVQYKNIVFVDINGDNVNINLINDDINTQRKEKKRKVNKSKVNKNNNNSSDSYPQEPVDNLQDENLAAIAKEFEKNGFGTINATVRDILIDFLDKYSVEWIVQAMKVAVKANKRTLSYVEGILKNWNANGGMQLESPQTNIAPKIKKNKFHNFEQRTDKYTADQLEEIARKKREEYYKKVVLGGNQDDK